MDFLIIIFYNLFMFKIYVFIICLLCIFVFVFLIFSVKFIFIIRKVEVKEESDIYLDCFVICEDIDIYF